MVHITKELNLQQEECFMLLQIHDELLFEIRSDIVKKRAGEIAQLMEKVVSLKVPLIVKISAGKNWGVQKNIQ